ncbi:fibrinogen-like YCDxxxxGGGW domain-containing protein [Enhygromyxa salina]|uniref:fibrinogen-like YCDxxxxGGGW domain-containing protein n=1 Tax=Enhygromyxa salina TaxID=215803 RepID=UPI0021590FAC|nr:fibrinogen-like YCDxxxxGGGW domain-containing protein [Enhygromyxa salina]
MALPLACFKGGSDEVGTTDMSTTDTGSADSSCEVGTLDCACTGGDGCDPGLECTDGICTMILSDCGNGQVEADEQCDDGNADNTDACTTLCMPPSCDDGIVSGDEIDIDCGIAACNVGCDFGQACQIANDCLFPVCGPDGDDGMVCQLPASCSDWLAFTPGATDGIIQIDPDGAAGDIPPAEVFCHMSKDGGGWTLVFTASDDGEDTWTWNNRAKLAGEPDAVGDLDSTNLDFMSPAYHTLPATDILFIHQPSDVWAHYANVGDGVMTLGQIVLAAGSPVCDYNLGGNGHELAGGTLTSSGQLCDTDLYFNLGDHEMDLASCMDFGSGSNTATFGPVWSADKGAGCPFDDPAEFGLGPHGPCGACPPNFVSTEFDYLGYGNALNLNTGAAGAGENYMQIYVR